MRYCVFCLSFILLFARPLQARGSDTSTLIQLPQNYLQQVSTKADKYYNSIISKTEKTLAKLSKWENKIKSILEKASPETAQRLFGNDQLTFAVLLEKYKEGKLVMDGYKARYDNYRDKLNSTLKYVEEKKAGLETKFVAPLKEAQHKLSQLNNQIENTEALQLFIKERKKQLLDQAVKFLGQHKMLQKIDKESFYYIETLRNYKEIFSEPGKAEALAVKLLKKVPGFNEFIERNSMLAGVFGTPGMGGNPNGTIGLLQSRAGVQSAAQVTIGSAGSSPQQFFQQALQLARGELSQLQQRMAQFGASGSDFEIPNFTPNPQRSKKFLQKIELSANIQSVKHNNFFPVSSDIGFSAGYKPNTKMIVGIGGSYKIGWGSGLNNIRITHQGLGIRSFLDWKLKGNLFASGGYEQNYFSEIRSIDQLRDYSSWKSSALLGIAKKYTIGKKRKGEMKLLYDFFSQTKVPKTSAVLFRVGVGL